MYQKRETFFYLPNKTYIEEMLRSYQDQHGTIKKENIPITVKIHPELVESDFLDENEHQYYQKILVYVNS